MGTFDQIFHAYISKPQEKNSISSNVQVPYHAETTIQWRLLTRYVMPIFQAATKPSEHLKAWMGLCDDGPTLRQDFHKAEQASSSQNTFE